MDIPLPGEPSTIELPPAPNIPLPKPIIIPTNIPFPTEKSAQNEDVPLPSPDVPKISVLGKAQAKKRLLAFSMTKQAGGTGLSFGFAKTTPLKVNKPMAQAFRDEEEEKRDKKKKKKDTDSRDMLAIEEIKREEERMKEALFSRPKYRERERLEKEKRRNRHSRDKDRDRDRDRSSPVEDKKSSESKSSAASDVAKKDEDTSVAMDTSVAENNKSTEVCCCFFTPYICILY